jgi:hypothetical protein
MTRRDAVRNSCPEAETKVFVLSECSSGTIRSGLRPQRICQLGCPTYAAFSIFQRLQVTVTELDVFFVFLLFLR